MEKAVHYKEVKNWRWPNFTPKEIACKGNGMLIINEKALNCLQKFRDLAACPVIINSAYRSFRYNKRVGGAPASQHLVGKAFDIQITEKLTRERIHALAKEVGFTGFGDYNTFVHIDTGPSRTWDLRK